MATSIASEVGGQLWRPLPAEALRPSAACVNDEGQLCRARPARGRKGAAAQQPERVLPQYPNGPKEQGGAPQGCKTKTAARSTAELIKEETTLVVTPKDFFSTAIDSLECLWRHTPPAAAVLYVATGPHSSRLGAYVDHCSAAVPGFRVVSCPELCNFYEMRNIAAGLTTTRYVCYINNDTFVEEGWLEALVEAAEAEPSAGVVAPIILERSTTHADTMHVWWRDLSLKRVKAPSPTEGQSGGVTGGFTYHLDARFEPQCSSWTLREVRRRIPTRRRIAFLEDHCFLARTAAFKDDPLHDPAACYRREFFDLAWEVAARGWEVWLEPRASVVYKKVQPMRAEDIPYFASRRTDELCYGSQLYLDQKWGVHYEFDRWHEAHRDEQLSGAVLSAERQRREEGCGRLVPCGGMMGGAHEARLVASLLMFAGFNRFCVSGASGCDRAQGVSAADSPTEVPSGDWMNGVALMAALPSLLCVGDASCNQKLEVKFAQEREALVSTETSPRRKAVPSLGSLVNQGRLPDYRVEWVEDRQGLERLLSWQRSKSQDPFSTSRMLRCRLLGEELEERLYPFASLVLSGGGRELWLWLRGEAASESSASRLSQRLCGFAGPQAEVQLLRWAYMPIDEEKARRLLKAADPAGLTWLWRAAGLLHNISATPEGRRGRAWLVLGDSNGTGQMRIALNVLPTSLAQRWLVELRRVASQGLRIKYADRVYNLPGSHHRRVTASSVWQALREMAEIIDDWRPGSIPELELLKGDLVPHPTPVDGSKLNARLALASLQDTLNILHKRFEIMRGTIKRPAPFFVEAPLRVQEAIQDYNIAIHRLEGIAASWLPWRNPPSPCIVAAFDHRRRRTKLRPKELRQFSPVLRFGCVYLNYCEVGKHLLEAFADRDEVVGDDNLRPQSHLSADAKLYLGQGRDAGQAAALLRDVRSWFEGRGVGRALGLPWGDPALALGFAPVAELDRGCPSLAGLETEEEVLLRVGCFPRVLGLEPG